MDATVSAALTTGVTGFADDAVAQLASVLPIALGVTITVGVLFLGIKIFRAITHV